MNKIISYFNFRKGQKGFTLIELLIALAITGLLTTVAASAISQIIMVNAFGNSHLNAIKQVENALHYINRDAQSAQNIICDNNTNFPLTMVYTDWNNIHHTITYSLTGNPTSLERTEQNGQQTANIVAININSSPGLTNCTYLNGILTINLTATVTGFKSATESRMLKVAVRAAQ
jgi:prepilin-type N-terminal cleavage/methylation domain-containing protein